MVGDRQRWALAVAVSLCAVLPLLAIEVWTGFRIAQTDPVLSVIAVTEQPLSVRSPAGAWALLLALAWFGMAYWQHKLTLWESALVVLGGALALARLGNAWLYAVAMLVPLARQLALLRPRPAALLAVAAVSLVVAGYTVVITRPSDLPAAATEAALQAPAGVVFADWRWAPGLQQNLPQARVLGAGGFTSEALDFWSQYVRLNYGGEYWSETLKTYKVNFVVIDGASAARPLADLIRGSAEWHVTYDADGVLIAQRQAA